MFDHLLRFYWPAARPTRLQAQPGQRGVGLVCTIGLVITLVLVAVASANAESKLIDRRNVIFDRLGSQDGLSQAGVSAIVQDHQGFVWVGTQEGLYRYDGYTFKTYYHMDEDEGSLSHDTIWDLLADSQGNIWVGTDAGLNRYNSITGKFVVVPLANGASNEVIHTLFEDRRGVIWIGTNLGLTRMSRDGSLAHYRHDPANSQSIGRGSVRALFEDREGRLWVGTEKGGLGRMAQEGDEFERFTRATGHLSDDYVRFIIEDETALWVATFNGGITRLDPRTGVSEFLRAGDAASELASDRVRALLKDQRGDIWVGSDGGLMLWRPSQGDFLRYTHNPADIHSISENTVFELFQDAGGVIWVGTFNGISKWNANIETFPHFSSVEGGDGGLVSNSVTSFTEAGDDIWIGTFNGLSRWSAETGRFDAVVNREQGLSDDMVMSLATRGSEIWAGTMSRGVNLLVDGQVIERFQHDEKDPTSISSNAVSAILVDSSDSVWLTTYGGGVNRYLGDGRFERFPKGAGAFSDLRTVDIEEAPDGRLWIATDGGGVVILNPEDGSTEIFRFDPADSRSLSSDNVISVQFAQGAMWVGTRDGGLNRFLPATSSFTRYTKSNGLASDAVYGILPDNLGRLWISGSKGLSVLDPASGRVTRYDSTHGLQSDDFNSGAHLRLSDGSLLFGGNNGFNAFDPAVIRGNDYVPPIVVTEFSKFNEPFALPTPVYRSDAITLNHDDFVIGFEFAAMDFTAPEKNRYQYRLEGFDRDWVDARPGTRQVTYTNLDSGEYRFRVRGSNNDGVWNEAGTSLGVVVKPPVWATWWAYIVYLAIGLALLYQVQKANEMRLRREAEKRYSERLQLYIESLEEATDCVLIADANKNLMYTNNAISAILGQSPAEAVGRSVLSLLFTDPSDAIAARNGLQDEGRWHGEVTSRRGTELVTTEVTIASVRDNSDNETAFVSIARDVTDRKRTQAELENHRRNLEFLVAERTKALEREIAENKAVQRELANSLKEKELLLKEVHHRVKNNMQVISSLLNIQAETIENKEFSSLLGESQQRIKSMSLIHENLYQSDNLLEIDFDDYINMLANSLCRFYTIPGVSIRLDIKVDDVSLDIETAVPCGLIINELISNSLKHAFRGREGCGTIRVAFRKSGCRYLLEISDDGIGLPADFEPSSSTSMGMEIVSILTQQLDGRLRIDGSEGAKFEISFPRQEKVNV
ncbi:MAG: two-component regulator propeller domain-containing protein [Pseudomonadota bacterium]